MPKRPRLRKLKISIAKFEINPKELMKEYEKSIWTGGLFFGLLLICIVTFVLIIILNLTQ